MGDGKDLFCLSWTTELIYTLFEDANRTQFAVFFLSHLTIRLSRVHGLSFDQAISDITHVCSAASIL